MSSPNQNVTDQLITEIAGIVAKRLGGNLRLLALYGSAAGNPNLAHDLDFLLVVDAVENCVTQATRDARDRYPQVQFFVLTAPEYAVLPGFFQFQFAFGRFLYGNLALPKPRREDAVEAIRHGFTDSLRTIRQQFKRREWLVADDWGRQVWWNLKSFKYALLDTCWILRQERPFDTGRAALILGAEGLESAARAVEEWPELDVAAQQLLQQPIAWLMRWEGTISAAYTEVRPYLVSK